MLPGLNAMATRWIPSNERSLAASIYTAGNQMAGKTVRSPLQEKYCFRTHRESSGCSVM